MACSTIRPFPCHGRISSPCLPSKWGRPQSRKNSLVLHRSNFANGRLDCKSSLNQDEDEEDGKFDLKETIDMALQSEESRSLLQDLAAAVERVEAAKRELEIIRKKEKTSVEQLVTDQAAAEEFVAACKEDVIVAELEVKAAQLALITAQVGSIHGGIDADLERIESAKAASVSAVVGAFVSLPLLAAASNYSDSNLLISLGTIVISCALFGVAYRYILRRDLGNIQLKAGAAAAFGLTRGLGQIDATQAYVDFTKGDFNEIFRAILDAGESVFIFVAAALALDYCLSNGLLDPFPSNKA